MRVHKADLEKNMQSACLLPQTGTIIYLIQLQIRMQTWYLDRVRLDSSPKIVSFFAQFQLPVWGKRIPEGSSTHNRGEHLFYFPKIFEINFLFAYGPIEPTYNWAGLRIGLNCNLSPSISIFFICLQTLFQIGAHWRVNHFLIFFIAK